MKDYVLVATTFVPDSWYGERYRTIVNVAEGVGFSTKAAANKFKSALKKFTKAKFRHSEKAKSEFVVGERSEFVSYTYVSCGPSISYGTTEITTEDLG